ncbi:BatD family protein [Vibrio superstes]|uniref:Protein BatD n=1 Tax=Vibrio superstes NBRC 103154 TaxID=1219062 RepID=A0A511QR22_9VIBR|nr:BatD family protein [Vibrio superstes]GEM79032.1 hypothetical protein VSU01S_12770 [Vibrio superstes NBRC 103154]
MRSRSFIFVILLSLAMSFTNVAIANDETPDVIVKTWIAQDQPVSVRQKVSVMVQIMTETWFTKGTKIHDIEVPNALVLGRSPFAQNSTTREKGKTYTTQTWEIVLYPLTTGEYVIPSMTIEYEVKGANTHQAQLFVTKELSLSVHQPSPKMHDSQPWLVSPKMNMTQDWEVIRSQIDEQKEAVSDQEPLNIGDVIQRTVSIEAIDTTVMLLPELEPFYSESHEVYQQVLTSKDSNHRGVHIAQRVQRQTYRVTNAGQITIPDIALLTWNPMTQEMTTTNLEGLDFRVKHTLSSWLVNHWLTLVVVLIILSVISFLILLGYKRIQTLKAQNALPLSWYYLSALNQKDPAMCESLLYRSRLEQRGWVALQAISPSSDWGRRIHQLQHARYGRDTKNVEFSTCFYLWLWLAKNKK